ncbi:MAG TPA: DEAD/DEAH box helicase [Cytophagaceae bacterium]|jgi:ATP-dependent RNA helicase RhlE|nr:DEAD/DEAH box helicase [Cytophagaceae bacterium]
MTFEDFKLNKQLLSAVADSGYTEPTEIQVKAIPQILAGHDIMGIAQTGTGKTAAYLLPILMKIKFAQGDFPRVLILVPTRELAMQVQATIIELAKYTDIRSVVAYGGVGPKTQIENIQKGVDIIVATPGRFMDIYLKRILVTKQLNTLVLDEADKMMDMGFMPQIRRILEIVPRKRQNLLFSATMPERVERLTEEFLEFPLKIEATPQATPVDTVTQVLYHVPNFKTKINLLQHFLRKKEEFHRVLVFVRTRQNAENLFKFITRKIDSEVKVIHANKGQNTRINSVEAFKDGGVRVLVATDVAARGIDISLVSHVINFDVPVVYEDYVHRIGRTGRAKNIGDAITFANEAEVYHMGKIEKIIKMKVPVKELPKEVKVEDSPFEENQEILRELDALRKKDDPTFMGAFHEKKHIPSTSKSRVRKKPYRPKKR